LGGAAGRGGAGISDGHQDYFRGDRNWRGVFFFAATPAAQAPGSDVAGGPGRRACSARFLAALAAALWAYDGWEDLNLVGSEVENPQRNFPRALVGGVALVAVIYLLFSAACLKVLPFCERSSVATHCIGRGGARGRGAERPRGLRWPW